MSYNRNLSIIPLFMVILSSGVTQAGAIGGSLATIKSVSGVVLVADGERFSTAMVGGDLTAGSRILTMENAKAALVYDDGCQLELGSNTMVAIHRADECTLKTVDSRAAGHQYAALGDSKAGAVVLPATGVESGAVVGGGVTATTWAVGAGTLGVAGVGLALDSGDGNSDAPVTLSTF
jgi:hypothetical protein